jgi:hypothetical protein
LGGGPTASASRVFYVARGWDGHVAMIVGNQTMIEARCQ